MHALAGRYPQYRWEHNVGYATANHLRGIAEHGITPHHRRSFLPVAQLSFDLSVPADVVALQLETAVLSRMIDEAAADLT